MPVWADVVTTATLTYAAHSAAACLLAFFAAKSLRRPQDRDLLWKAALVAPILTSAATFALSLFVTGGAVVDLAAVVRRASPLILPARRVSLRIIETAAGRDVFRQVSDPVSSALSMLAMTAGAASVAVALMRFMRRRVALRHALQQRASPTGVPAFAHDGVARISVAPDLPSPVALSGNEICLPADVAYTFAPERRRALLAHEVAHLDRRDPQWFLVAEIVGVITAFQPLVFAVLRAFRRDAELICDEAAVCATNDPIALIGALAQLATPFDPRCRLQGIATAHDGSPLVDRATRIASLPAQPGAQRRRIGAALVVSLLFAALCTVPTVGTAASVDDLPANAFGDIDGFPELDRIERVDRAVQRMLFVDGAVMSERRTVFVIQE